MSEREIPTEKPEVQGPDHMARIQYLQAKLRRHGEELEEQKNLIAELRQRNQELEVAAVTDELTGAYNRRGWSERVGVMIDLQAEREKQEQEDVYILLVDADEFKGINDEHGHAAGDEILKLIVRTITGAVRDYDVVGRIGGEEFVIALFGASLDDVCRKAEYIKDAVKLASVEVDGKELSVTVSVGVGPVYERTVGGPKPTESDALRKADQAMYEAKRRGRNQVSVHPDAAA